MGRVTWSGQAILNLEAVQLYILPFNKRAALRLAQRITLAAESLADFPRCGRELDGDVRQLSLVYPYLIRYHVGENDEVLILSVRHGARAEG